MRRITTVIVLVAFASLLVGADGEGCACSPARVDEYPTTSATSSGEVGGSVTTTTGTGTSGGVGGTGGTGGVGGSPCGDGDIDSGEGCDDSNTIPKDGCSDTCQIELCYECAQQGMPCSWLIAGTPCSDNSMMFCDGQGECVEHCQDTAMTGDETGEDCGGADCGACDSTPCEMADECASGYCVDKVCCKGICGNSCQACNLPDTVGSCANIPAGVDDTYPSNTCTGTAQITCDGQGTCLMPPNNTKFENGTMCTGKMDCVSNLCSPVPSSQGAIKKCGAAKDAMCDINEECASFTCQNGNCADPP